MTVYRPTKLLTTLAATFLSPLAAAAALPAEYTFLDLGTLGGADTRAYALNDAGQVAGSSADPTGLHLAFRTAPNAPINPATDNLGSLSPGYDSSAYAINSAGQVAGQSGTPSGDRAFLYAAGTMTNLGTLGGDWSYAYALNASGQVTGGAAKPSTFVSYPTPASLYSAGKMYSLGTLGGTEAYGHSINSAGAVVGYSDTTPDPSGYAPKHAFLWTPSSPNATTGTLADLGTLGGLESYAFALNDAGQIVGGSTTTGDAAYHAFLRTPAAGALLDLGTLGGSGSEASAINAKGHLVGWADAPGDVTSAFVYTGGRMRNLNDLTAAPAGWTLSHAQAINDAGQIAGYATAPDGHTRAFLLSPIPTWAADADTTWSAPANWSTPAAPNAPGATANLTAATTAPRAITLDAPVTLGQLNLANPNAYTLAGPNPLTISGGPAAIHVYQGPHEISAPLALGTGATLAIDDGAALKLSGPITGTLAALSLAPTARLDLTDNTLVLSSTPADTLRQYLLAGSLLSSSSDPTHTLGYLFSGEPTAPTSFLVKLTLIGDANLDGQLNADDYTLLDRAFAKGTTNAHWTDGDFNYDGMVTSADYLSMDRTYGQAQGLSPAFLSLREAQFGPAYVSELLAATPTPQFAPAVPEPAAPLALLPAAITLLPLRHRRRR